MVSTQTRTANVIHANYRAMNGILSRGMKLEWCTVRGKVGNANTGTVGVHLDIEERMNQIGDGRGSRRTRDERGKVKEKFEAEVGIKRDVMDRYHVMAPAFSSDLASSRLLHRIFSGFFCRVSFLDSHPRAGSSSRNLLGEMPRVEAV